MMFVYAQGVNLPLISSNSFLSEWVEGIKVLFSIALGRRLLYAFERVQVGGKLDRRRSWVGGMMSLACIGGIIALPG